MIKKITIFGFILFSFLFSGQIILAQSNTCYCQAIPATSSCRQVVGSNECLIGSGPVLTCTPPTCTCNCSTSAPIKNQPGIPGLGNNCQGRNCGYPTSGMECQANICVQSFGAFIAPPAYASDQPPTICDFEKVISGILGFALGFAGLALFIIFIIGGYKWLTAGTNEKAVQQAKSTFTMAIIGMALTFGAWFALLFIERFTGIQVTLFQIPGCT